MSDPGWVQPVARIDADIAVVIAAADHTQTFDDLTPAEALGVNIAARLPDNVRVQLLAWIDGQPKPNAG